MGDGVGEGVWGSFFGGIVGGDGIWVLGSEFEKDEEGEIVEVGEEELGFYVEERDAFCWWGEGCGVW